MDKSRQVIELNFGNLPLVETVVRASLTPPVPLTFKLLNFVAERMRADFPEMAEPPAIEGAPGLPPVVPVFGQLPGATYVGNAKGLVLSVQDQLVAVRWIKRVVTRAPDYPRFPALKEVLWKAVDAVRQGVANAPGVAVVNMSYTNFIEASEPVSVLQDYFSPIAHLAAIQGGKIVQKLEAAWREPTGVDLRFQLRQVTAKLPDKQEEGYQLLTASGKRLSASDDPTIALDDIHQGLQHFFARLISERAKKEWQLEEKTRD